MRYSSIMNQAIISRQDKLEEMTDRELRFYAWQKLDIAHPTNPRPQLIWRIQQVEANLRSTGTIYGNPDPQNIEPVETVEVPIKDEPQLVSRLRQTPLEAMDEAELGAYAANVLGIAGSYNLLERIKLIEARIEETGLPY
jgi:hypothetical protein